MSVMYQADFEVSTPNDFSILRADPLIDSGTILLWNPARSGQSSYTNGSVIPDVAADDSALLLGVDKSQTNSALFVPTYPTEFLVEKTAKGALHLMATQNVLGGANRRTNLPLPQAVKNYIEANNTHKFYVSFVGRFTRKSTLEKAFFLLGRNSYTGNYYFYMRSSPTSASNISGPSTGATYSPSNQPAVDVPFLFTVEVTAKVGTWDINGATTFSGLFQGDFSTAMGGHPSLILYSATISDLTVSGKTATQKRAEEFALFTAAFAEGGEFHGDTWTNPAVALPTSV
jgi:hypothetical protein